jgi:hypothetical protein
LAGAVAGSDLDSTRNCGAPGVTLEFLHLEYLQEHPDGYRYSAFCRHYREWLGRQRLVDAPGAQGRDGWRRSGVPKTLFGRVNGLRSFFNEWATRLSVPQTGVSGTRAVNG